MKKIRIITYLLILVLVLSITSACSDKESSSIQQSEFNKNIIQEEIIKKLSEGDVAGVSVYIESPKLSEPVFLAEGFADKENLIKAEPLTKYRIGSITKSFTGMAILMLHDQGLLNLNDPVTDYLDYKHPYFENITIKEAMNMTTGLKGYINDLDEDNPKTMENSLFYDFVENYPGEKIEPEALLEEAIRITEIYGIDEDKEFHYSNTNYIILGMIIEKASGMSYESFIEKNIIEPLDLNNTIVPYTPELPANSAKGYIDFNEDGIKEDMTYLHPSYVWAAGSIISDVQDIGKWMRALASKELVSQETLKYFFEEGALAKESTIYTAGVIVLNGNDLWHNGTVLGYHGDFYYDNKTDSVISILSNSNSEGIDVTKEIMELILDEIIK